MFEDLYEKSVQYDDHLLQAACTVQAEFDLEQGFVLTDEIREFIQEVAEEYQVSQKDLIRRIREIV